MQNTRSSRPDFSLSFFGSGQPAKDPYQLVLSAARFADANGFSGVWVPERHFSELGRVFPSPPVLLAALARETKHIRLCGGSVVLPLHDPIRVAEEWAVLDHLSAGRGEIAFASGWGPTDFVLYPDRFASRHQELYRLIDEFRRLWSGEPAARRDGLQAPVEVRVYPRPLSSSLPLWITSAGNPRTFASAGKLGFNLLTHLFAQDLDKLGQQIALYRHERSLAGHDPLAGRVCVMVHTFVAQSEGEAKEHARKGFLAYLKQNLSLAAEQARVLGITASVQNLPPEEIDQVLEFAYDRFASARALIGSPESCAPLVQGLVEAGVDEIGCLIDFVDEHGAVVKNLEMLDELRRVVQQSPRTTPALHDISGSRQAPSPSSVSVGTNPPDSTAVLTELRARCIRDVPMSEVYSSADDAVSYGDGFKAVRRLQAGEREAIAELTLSHEVDSAHGGALHPALWDSSLQPLAYLVAKTAAAANLQATMHTGYAEVIVHRSALTPLFSYAVLADESKGTGEITGDVKIFTSDGDLVAEMKGVRYKVLAKDDELSTTAHHIPSTPARADAVLERLRSARSREDGVAAFSAYLVKVMATLLPEGTREITPTTNFADAGLDSLRAIEIRNRISNEIGITISLVDFLREATIERLASRCWTLHFAPKEEDHEEIIL